MTVPAARRCVRGALLALSLLACNFAAAVLAQSSEPPAPAGSIGPTTSAGPQQTAPQSSPPTGLPPSPAPPSAAAPPAAAGKRGLFRNPAPVGHDSAADLNANPQEH